MPPVDDPNLARLSATEDEDFLQVWAECQAFTSDSWHHGLAIFRAVRHLSQQKVPGVFVDLGYDRGGSTLIAIRTLQLCESRRRFVLFNTAADPSPPDWQQLLSTSGYDLSLLRMIDGDLESRLPQVSIADAAWLRIGGGGDDSIVYSALVYLYPRLVHGGVVLVSGADSFRPDHNPVTEYFGEIGPAPLPRPAAPLWCRIDGSTRMAVKLDEATSSPTVSSSGAVDSAAETATTFATGLSSAANADPQPTAERYDYFPPGLANPGLQRNFPSLVAGNLRRNKWRFLRDAAPHIWRIDDRSRSKGIGVLSMEEAILLYNVARPLAGKRGLAIGCHYAWSTAHLLAAGLEIDVLDPCLSDWEHQREVQSSLDSIHSPAAYRLWAGFSPSMIPAVRAVDPRPWHLAFIDGDHDGDAPRLDAAAVLPHLADEAVVVFHDLVSPYVAAGLDVFRQAGWRITLYNTMQVMGVASRGSVSLPNYESDPAMPPLPDHLQPT